MEPSSWLVGARVLRDGVEQRIDLRLDGPRIGALMPGGRAPADGLPRHSLDGLLLMPAVVDSHVHINEPGRTEWEGFESATRAAALGGVCALGDMPLNCVPVTTSLQALEQKIEAARGKLQVDVGLWGGVVPGNGAELAPMVRAGARGFKCFLCPSGIDEFPAVDESALREAMRSLRPLGVPLLTHAELELPLREAAVDSSRDYSDYLHSRPPSFEVEAVALLLRLCRETGCPVHIVHVSAAEVLPLLRAARAEGLPVTAETCPHYLCLRAEDIPPGATEFKCAPPIREGANRERLWAALAEGVLDFVVTDHSPCLPSLKLPAEGDFMRAWGGIASLQLGLASVATEAARRGYSRAQVCRWLNAGARELLGMPSGRIAAGAPADLVAWDPEASFRVDPERLAHRHPVSPYAGRRMQGRVHHLWVGGYPVVRDGRIHGTPRGRILGASP